MGGPMKVLLKKVRAKTLFSLLDPVRVEPLELAYLLSAIEEMGAQAWIIDDLFKIKALGQTPDVIVLTGYNTAEDLIIKETLSFRRHFPLAKIIIGGIHAQCNSQVFHVPSVDYVFHSPDLKQFQNLLKQIEGTIDPVRHSGFDEQRDGRWTIGTARPLTTMPKIQPDRSLTRRVLDRTRYLDKSCVALVKGRTGCPYQCDFCYCRLLNDGLHLQSNFETIFSEAQAIEANFIWVVDDVFLASRKDALEFIRSAQSLRETNADTESTSKEGVKGPPKFIVYLRADFILKNSDLLEQLKASGMEEVIVGFEAITNTELDSYHKETDALDYPQVIQQLKKHRIDLTALFMVSPHYQWADFRRLRLFLKNHEIETYTISILTPIKGTHSYEQMKDQLITKNPKKFDFLHLVIKSTLPKPLFYFLFWQLHFRLLRSPRI